MHDKRIVGTVAMLLGLALLVLPWALHRVNGGVEGAALLVSGLATSVFGTALGFAARGHPRRPR